MTAFKRLLALFLCLLSGAAAALELTGDVHVKAIIVDFSNRAYQHSPEKVRQWFCDSPTSTAAVLYESSGGRLRLTCDVLGPVKITSTSSGCQYSGWGREADLALIRQGTPPPTSFDIGKSYVFPGNGCSARGYAYMFHNLSYLVSGGDSGYATHELGHNFGFGHASTVGSEYGDGGDFMGGTSNMLSNAPNRIASGWLPESAIVNAKPGLHRYTIRALDSFDSRPQVVVGRTEKDTFYVSFRQAVGLDARLPADYLDAVSVHDRKWQEHMQTYQPTMRRGQYRAGEEYTSKDKNYRVRVIDIGADYAEVEVDAGLPGCTSPFPTTTLSGPSTVEQGGVAEVVATFTSRSPESCIAQDFKVIVSGGPKGAPREMSDTTVRLRPGESRDVRIVTVVPRDQPLGASTLSVSAIPGGSGTVPTKHTLTVVAAAEPVPEPTLPPEPEPQPEPEPEPTTPGSEHDEPPTTELESEPQAPTEPAPTGSASIPAAADTYLSSYHPTSSFGSKKEMMHNKASSNYHPMLRFDVLASQGGPVPDGAEIVSAKLRIYKSSAYNFTYRLHRNLNEWVESVTLRDEPPFAADADAEATVGWEPGWLEFDVTQAVTAARYGWRMVGVAGNTNIKRFVSREGAPELAPRLDVEWR